MNRPLYDARQFAIIMSAADGDTAEMERLRNLNYKLGYNLTDMEREQVMSAGFPLAIRLDPDFAMNRAYDNQLSMANKSGIAAGDVAATNNQDALKKLTEAQQESFKELMMSINNSQNPLGVLIAKRNDPDDPDQLVYKLYLKNITHSIFESFLAPNKEVSPYHVQLLFSDMQAIPELKSMVRSLQAVYDNTRGRNKPK